MHVVDAAASGLDEQSRETLKAATERRLQEEARRVPEDFGCRIQFAALQGNVTEELARFAESRKASAVIVSSLGYGSSPLLRVGGTSERLTRLGRVPVLVIRDATPFERWARDSRPLRVLLGLDATASADPAIHWLKELRKAGPCEVIVGHVYYPSDAARRYGLPRRASAFAPDAEIEKLILRDLETRTGTIPGTGGVSYRAQLGVGRTGDHLLELAEHERADLIVVGTHHRRGLGRLTSVSSIVLHFGHASVACVPGPATAVRGPREIPALRRVLIATDLSPISNDAVAYGYALLAPRGGEVHLLHVVSGRQRGQVPHEDGALISELRSLVPPNATEEGLVTRTEVVHSDDPAQAITEAAERVGADLVCVASHGRTGVRRAVLGSVAEAVLRQSSRPVFVVRPLHD